MFHFFSFRPGASPHFFFFLSNFSRVEGAGLRFTSAVGRQEEVLGGVGDCAGCCALDAMERDGLHRWLVSNLSGLRDGDLAGADFLNSLLSFVGLELHSRAIVGSAKVRWVVGIRDRCCLEKDFLSTLDSQLRLVNTIQTSLNDWLESGRQTLLYSFGQLCWEGESYSEEPSEASIASYAVVVSAVVLLSFVYQYLTGNVDRGGSRAYSRSSLDFRDIYVAIVLFLGAYVWIKFREAACRGVYRRELPDKKGGTKVVYEARLKPPMWNGKKVPRLDLGRFTTPQEAHNKFLIAAFYYDRDAGLLDGWFQVPSMSDEERSLTGLELRAWVIAQAKKVYEEFTAVEAALLLHELSEAYEDSVMQEQDEVNVNLPSASLLNSIEHQQLALMSQAKNSGMGMAMIGDHHGLECASHSFDGMHEGLVLSNGHNLGSQEGSALPVSQPPPNTESGMSLNGNDQLDLLQTLVRTQQQQICLLQQQSSDQQQQIYLLQQQSSDQRQQLIYLQQRQIQDFGALMLQFQNKQGIQQQQLQESWIQNPQWSYQSYPQEQQLQDVNQGVPGFEMEMEQSMHQQNYSGFTAPPPDGGEAQEAFWELDTFTYVS